MFWDTPATPLTSEQSRAKLADQIERELGPFPPLHLEALRRVPRERFVREADAERAYEDAPLPLDDVGLATVSAPHAYLLSFRLLDLAPGDELLELGSGSGYGAALASEIVGPDGRVTTVEIDAGLAHRATELLADRTNVRVVLADAGAAVDRWASANRVTCTFAVHPLPQVWVDALAPGGVLVVPVGPPHGDQRLIRLARSATGELAITDHAGVRYVQDRGVNGRPR